MHHSRTESSAIMATPFGEPGSATTDSTINDIYDSYAEGRARAIARGMAVRDIGTPPISDDDESGSEADSSTPRARTKTSMRHDLVDNEEGAVTFLNPPGTPRTIMMNIEVKLRLLPALHLLTKANQTGHDRNEAIRIAAKTRTFPKRGDSEDDPFEHDRRSLTDMSPIEGGGERIPSFSTWRSSDAGSPQAGSPEAGIFPSRRPTRDPWSLKGGKRVAVQGAFQPSFNSGNEALSPTQNRLDNGNPLSASSTKSHFGLAWSKHHPYGKGEIIPGKTFDSVSSPENISSESERDIPHNVLGGLVDVTRLNAKKTETRGREWGARRRSYVPEGVSPPRKVYVAQNMLTGHDSPLSDLSPSSDSSIPVILASPRRPAYFGQGASYTGADPSAPILASDFSSSYPYSASAVGEDKSAIPVGAGSDSPRKRRMGSLSVIATGLDLAGVLPHRRRSDMAAPEQKLEEGESPFSPKKGDGGFYVTGEGIIEEEV
nr:hypothetical protein B0A51_09861 [Rachicladosporium sp. CCFEE 5018]